MAMARELPKFWSACPVGGKADNLRGEMSVELLDEHESRKRIRSCRNHNARGPTGLVERSPPDPAPSLLRPAGAAVPAVVASLLRAPTRLCIPIGAIKNNNKLDNNKINQNLNNNISNKSSNNIDNKFGKNNSNINKNKIGRAQATVSNVIVNVDNKSFSKMIKPPIIAAKPKLASKIERVTVKPSASTVGQDVKESKPADTVIKNVNLTTVPSDKTITVMTNGYSFTVVPPNDLSNKTAIEISSSIPSSQITKTNCTIGFEATKPRPPPKPPKPQQISSPRRPVTSSPAEEPAEIQDECPAQLRWPKMKPLPRKIATTSCGQTSITTTVSQAVPMSTNIEVSLIETVIDDKKTDSSADRRTPIRVVRKPLLPPPPPPVGASSAHRNPARNSVAFPLDGRAFSLPRMPAILPPLPPAVGAPYVPLLDAFNEKADEPLYEEIGQIYQAFDSPKSLVIDSTLPYTPKYRKKSETCQSPGYNYCTSVHFFDCTPSEKEGGAVTLPAEFRRKISTTDAPAQIARVDGMTRRASYRQARFQSQSSRFDTWSAPIGSNNNKFNNSTNFQDFGPTTSADYDGREVDYDFDDDDREDELYGNHSVENYCTAVESDFSTVELPKMRAANLSARHRRRRRPLSELWRFKSELQLNLSRKVSRICAKVENSIGQVGHNSQRPSHSPAIHSNGNDGRRRSVFYVDEGQPTESACLPPISVSTQPTVSPLPQPEDSAQPNVGDESGSLLAEIERAYIELQRRRATETMAPTVAEIPAASPTAGPSAPTVNDTRPRLPPPPPPPPPPPLIAPPAAGESTQVMEQVLLRVASDIGSKRTVGLIEVEAEAAERYDQRHNVTQRPSSSASSVSTSFSSVTDSSELSPTESAAGTTPAGALDNVPTTEDEAEPEFEDDETNPDKTHNSYTSWLPAPQPLYQHYIKQKQDRLFADPSVQANGSQKLEEEPTVTKATVVEFRTAPAIPRKKGTAVSAVPAAPPLAEETHEAADNVSDSASNDEITGVCIRRQSSSVSTDSGRGADTLSHVTSSNTSMRRERLTAGSVYGSQRSLWCELPEVRSAGLLDALDKHSKRLQEAYFEVITSEASYLRSLNVLITKFMAAPELLGAKSPATVITSAERRQLFSNVLAIRDCSERLLCDLEQRLKENLVLSDVCDILGRHFEHQFDAYVKYCSNQVYQDRTLKRLKASNAQFLACVARIESDRQCQGLDMRSFLMLPMQRVTRYPLLLYAIVECLERDTPPHDAATQTLMLANKVVCNCNEGARKMERTEQLLEIERSLVYKSADLKRIPLATSGRYVLKSGLVTQLSERNRGRTASKLNVLQSKQRTRSLFLFLFNDLLLIAKRKPNGTFICKDYAARQFIVIEPVEPHSNKVPAGMAAALPGKPHLFFCILMNNARGKHVELLLNTDSELDRERWITAMRPPTCTNPDERIYAEWDCPQAIAAYNYEAGQDDELDLTTGDFLNILRKVPDGWYYGLRLMDNKAGWFPSSYVRLILNDHIRANNYRQRLRLFQSVTDELQHQHGASRGKRASLPASTLLNASTSFNVIGGGSGGAAEFYPSGLDEQQRAAFSASPRASQESLLISRLRRLSNPKALFSMAND